MSRRLTIAVLLLLAPLAAGAQAAMQGSIKDQMKAVVDPASNLLFAVGGDVDPANGPDALKVPAARWDAAAAAAARLQTVAAALQQPGQAKDKGAWMDFARQMDVTAGKAAQAARAHDGAGLAQAANDLSDVCSACHAKYKPQS